VGLKLNLLTLHEEKLVLERHECAIGLNQVLLGTPR